MKHNVSTLSGRLLDAAVASLEGWDIHWTPDQGRFSAWRKGQPGTLHAFNASVNWAIGGPIIERERISVAWNPVNEDPIPWCACYDDRSGYHYGATPLVSAMRAYVASKFGDEVELP